MTLIIYEHYVSKASLIYRWARYTLFTCCTRFVGYEPREGENPASCRRLAIKIQVISLLAACQMYYISALTIIWNTRINPANHNTKIDPEIPQWDWQGTRKDTTTLLVDLWPFNSYDNVDTFVGRYWIYLTKLSSALVSEMKHVRLLMISHCSD